MPAASSFYFPNDAPDALRVVCVTCTPSRQDQNTLENETSTLSKKKTESDIDIP